MSWPAVIGLMGRTYVDPETGCCVWQGQSEYCTVTADRKTYKGHRLVWETILGQLPLGVDLHHVCGNTRCLNVAHLEPLLHGSHAALHQTLGEACKRGHPWTNENTYYSPAGKRICRSCRAAGKRKRRSEGRAS